MSAQLKENDYVPELQIGAHVQVLGGISCGSMLTGTVIRALSNPSHQSDHQWYDVKLEGGKIRRFHTFFIKPATKS